MSGEESRAGSWPRAEKERDLCADSWGYLMVDLDMLVTHPEYRGRGAASMLVQWGCDRADEKGVPVYLDAHEDAAPLYRRFGFQDCYEHGVTSDGALPMVREPQQKER